MMEREERLNFVFNYLRSKGLIQTQRDLANKMHAGIANISKALKGNKSVLTDRFLRRLNSAFGDIFNEDWLLLGKGEMLSAAAAEINIFGNGNALGAAAKVTSQTTNNFGSCGAENSRADATLNKVLDMLQAAQDRIGEIQTQLTEHNSTSTKMLDMLQAAQDRIGEIQTQLTEHNSTSTKMLDMLQEKDALILRLTNKLLDK